MVMCVVLNCADGTNNYYKVVLSGNYSQVKCVFLMMDAETRNYTCTISYGTNQSDFSMSSTGGHDETIWLNVSKYEEYFYTVVANFDNINVVVTGDFITCGRCAYVVCKCTTIAVCMSQIIIIILLALD